MERPAALSIETASIAPGIHEIKLVGDLDRGSTETFHGVIQEALANRRYRIVVDLRRAPYLCGLAISILIDATRIAREHGGELVLASVMPKIRRVMVLLGVDSMLAFAETSEAAVKRLSRRLTIW